MKREIIGIFAFLLVILLAPILVEGVCTLTLDDTNYTEEGLVTVTGSCSLVNEQSQTYTINFTNSTGYVLEIDTGTTPAVKNTPFFETFSIPAGYVAVNGSWINVNMTGTNLEGTDQAYVSVASASDLILNNFSITEDYYIGRRGAIKFRVLDSSLNAVANALCTIDVVNGDDLPILNAGGVVSSQGDGYVLFSNLIASVIFIEGGQYKWGLSCTCFNATESNAFSPGYCYDESTGNSITTFKHGEAQYPFTITDIADKMIVNKTVDLTAEHGIWVENEKGYRINMSSNSSTTLLDQENIDWNNYAEVDGEAFLTAGEKFRVCAYYNNTFDGSEFIILKGLNLIKYPGKMVYPLKLNGEELRVEEEFMHIHIKTDSYEKCGNWLIVPLNIKGQTMRKISFHMQIEGYEQLVDLTSDRFTVFGERTDTDYPDFLTINNVTYIFDNATEGEYVQLELNITNNHPNKDITAKVHLELQANEGGEERQLHLVDWDSGEIYNHHLDYERLFDANETDIILTPRFQVPYGTVDQDAYDTFGAHIGLHILSATQGEKLWTQFWTGTEPTIDITDKDLDLTNITTTISNTEVSACSTYIATLSYDNTISHTNATGAKEDIFIIRGCIEDTTNDIYIHCTDLEVQPDKGSSKQGSFITTLPYFSSAVEAELDVFVYTKDETNLDESCKYCGELVDSISGDEGDATFNVTVNSTTACRYSKDLGVLRDDQLYLNWRQTGALETINNTLFNSTNQLAIIANKTGTFAFSIDARPTASSPGTIDFDLSALLEIGSEEETEGFFSCYIESYKAQTEIQFRHAINNSVPYEVTKTLNIPKGLVGIYTVHCDLGYLAFGNDKQPATDTFVARRAGSFFIPGQIAFFDIPIEEFFPYLIVLVAIIVGVIICILVYRKKEQE